MAKQVRGHRANKPNDSFGTVNNKSLYRGKYRDEVDNEDEDENQDAEVEEQDAEPIAAAEDETKTESFAESKSPETDYKKRYDDLKKHYDGKLSEWKQEKEDFVTRLNTTQRQPTEEASELGDFKNQYPDVYDAIHKISSSQSEARVKGLEEELSQIKEREKALEKQKSYQELLRLQPDFDELSGSKNSLNLYLMVFTTTAQIHSGLVGWLICIKQIMAYPKQLLLNLKSIKKLMLQWLYPVQLLRKFLRVRVTRRFGKLHKSPRCVRGSSRRWKLNST